MNEETENEINKLKDEIEELKVTIETLRDTINTNRIGLQEEIDYHAGETTNMHKLARAVCELQEEMRKQHEGVFFTNEINAPTMVGMS